MSKSQKPNIDYDARLVFLCMRGMQLQAGIEFGITPSELQKRADWLRKQPETYVNSVVARVEEMER
jgi:hypothetical protein